MCKHKFSKTGGSMELFLPKNDFKSYYTLNFPKRHSYFRGLEANQRHEFRLEFFVHVLYVNLI